MVGWHNAVATRLGEALAETEKHRNTLIHRFLSPRFTGLKIILISSRGVRLRQAYAETGPSRGSLTLAYHLSPLGGS